MRSVANPSSPRYQSLKDEIIERIRSGSLALGARMESPEELANQLDASASTVRLTYQNLASQGILVRIPRRGTMVSQEALRIIGGGRSTKKENQLALLVPDVRLPEYAELAGACLDMVEEYKKEVAVYSTDDDRDRYDIFIRRCIAQQCDGLILVPPLYSQLKPQTLVAIEEARMPVVSCWRPIEALGAPVIRTDPSRSIFTMTRHVIEAGCKVVALLSFDSPIYEFEFTRLSGFCGYQRAISAVGMRFDESWNFNYPIFDSPNGLVNCENTPEFQRLLRWLRDTPQIDAIVCQHDALAVLAYKAIMMLNRSIPKDILLTGVGNHLPYTSMMHPSLTTYGFEMKDFARRAIHLINEMRMGQKPRAGLHEIVEGHIIIGGSTAREPNPAGADLRSF